MSRGYLRLKYEVVKIWQLYCFGLQSESSGVQSFIETTDIRQEGHSEFKALRCFSTKSGSKASV